MAENNSLYRERLIQATERGLLIELVNQLKAEGVAQRGIFDLLEEYRYELHQEGRTDYADYLIAVSDRVWGFCAPDKRLFEIDLYPIDEKNEATNAGEMPT